MLDILEIKLQREMFGRVQRRTTEYVGRRTLGVEVPGRRPKGKPKTWYVDIVKEHMKSVDVSKEDA